MSDSFLVNKDLIEKFGHYLELKKNVARNILLSDDVRDDENAPDRQVKKDEDAKKGVIRKPRKKAPPKQNKKPKGKFVCEKPLMNGQICGKLESLFRRLDLLKPPVLCNDCWRRKNGQAVK